MVVAMHWWSNMVMAGATIYAVLVLIVVVVDW